MEFIKVMEIKDRICNKYKHVCYDCPLSSSNNKHELTCTDLMRKNPAEAEKIITDWDDANPVKTYLMDFLEKYPNALMKADGAPYACPSKLGYCEEFCCVRNDCFKCWSTPLNEKIKIE